jgi:hypothetical protein
MSEIQAGAGQRIEHPLDVELGDVLRVVLGL